MNCRNPVPWLLGIAVGLVLASSAHAQEREEGVTDPREEHFHRNELALVLASTYEAEEGKNLFTLGGEYDRRFVDHSAGDAKSEGELGVTRRAGGAPRNRSVVERIRTGAFY